MAKELSILDQLGRIQEEFISKPMSKIETVLHRWTTERINKSISILEENGRNASLRLSQSISIDDTTFGVDDKGTYTIDVLAMDYWQFIDSGVDGTQIKYGSPYSFKDHQPTSEDLISWMSDKGIRSLSWYDRESGKQIEKPLVTLEDYKAAAFVIAKAVKRKGIEPSGFITNSFTQQEIDKLVKELVNLF